jgi:PIN domain nuclease of toxin-antitoxin system
MIDVARLPPRVRSEIREAAQILVSPASVYEIAQKVRLGKWAAMEQYMVRPDDLVAEQGFAFAPVSADILLRAAKAEWNHRDPFDRILGATAETMDAVFLTNDPAFENGPFQVTRVWS